MKTIATLIALIPVLVCQAVVIPDQSSGHGAVYIVTRAASAESRALLSARLIKLNATKLHWYEGANVVRAEVPEEALPAVRADRDVVLALAEQSSGTHVIDLTAPVIGASILEPALPTPLAPQPMQQQMQQAPQMQQAGCNQFAPMPQMGMAANAGCNANRAECRKWGMAQMGMPQMELYRWNATNGLTYGIRGCGHGHKGWWTRSLEESPQNCLIEPPRAKSPLPGTRPGSRPRVAMESLRSTPPVPACGRRRPACHGSRSRRAPASAGPV